MESIYSEIKTVTVPKFKIAKYSTVGTEPEEAANSYMDVWAERNSLLKIEGYTPHKIGWDYPATKEQTDNGFHGYTSAYILPDNFAPVSVEGVEIIEIGEDTYATLTVTEPSIAPWERIPIGYDKLLNNSEVKTLAWEDRVSDSWGGRIAFEEFYKKDGTEYMDIFVPISCGNV